jgi:hypothetical protein
MKISKNIVITLIVIGAIILIAVGVWAGMRLSDRGTSTSALSPYSAVYLSTGDIYFGTLDWYPTPHMENAWFLQHTTDAKGNAAVGVYPLSSVAWGSSGEISFNPQQIIFWTRLNATSSIAQLIANPAAVEAAAAQTTPYTQGSPNATSSAASQ